MAAWRGRECWAVSGLPCPCAGAAGAGQVARGGALRQRWHMAGAWPHGRPLCRMRVAVALRAPYTTTPDGTATKYTARRLVLAYRQPHVRYQHPSRDTPSVRWERDAALHQTIVNHGSPITTRGWSPSGRSAAPLLRACTVMRVSKTSTQPASYRRYSNSARTTHQCLVPSCYAFMWARVGATHIGTTLSCPLPCSITSACTVVVCAMGQDIGRLARSRRVQLTLLRCVCLVLSPGRAPEAPSMRNAHQQTTSSPASQQSPGTVTLALYQPRNDALTPAIECCGLHATGLRQPAPYPVPSPPHTVCVLCARQGAA